ncbi:tyrosine transaminase family protein [Tanacetum coccineum]
MRRSHSWPLACNRISDTGKSLRIECADYCNEGLKDVPGVTCPTKPAGAMCVMVKLDMSVFKDIKDDMDFCVKLAREESVLFLPDSECALKRIQEASCRRKHSVVRDMSLNVGINAFNALGNVGVVSDSILLQTLSKRIDKELPRRHSVKHFNLPISTGAFVHGLKDEFVRIHAIRSATCTAGALDLLMDVLNDDSAIVRLQAPHASHGYSWSSESVRNAHAHSTCLSAERINQVAHSINEPQESFPKDSSNSNKRIMEKQNVVVKADHCIGLEVEKLADGGVLLLENISMSTMLLELHTQAHDSTEGVTKFLKPYVAGFRFLKELDYLDGAVFKTQRGHLLSVLLAYYATPQSLAQKIIRGAGLADDTVPIVKNNIIFGFDLHLIRNHYSLIISRDHHKNRGPFTEAKWYWISVGPVYRRSVIWTGIFGINIPYTWNDDHGYMIKWVVILSGAFSAVVRKVSGQGKSDLTNLDELVNDYRKNRRKEMEVGWFQTKSKFCSSNVPLTKELQVINIRCDMLFVAGAVGQSVSTRPNIIGFPITKGPRGKLFSKELFQLYDLFGIFVFHYDCRREYYNIIPIDDPTTTNAITSFPEDAMNVF